MNLMNHPTNKSVNQSIKYATCKSNQIKHVSLIQTYPVQSKPIQSINQ